MKNKFPGFKKCMEMMRDRDGQTKEDGFHWLLPYVGDYIHELIGEFKQEKALGLRCWLLELIGSGKSPASFDFLAEELHGPDQQLRIWAAWGLTQVTQFGLRNPGFSREIFKTACKSRDYKSLLLASGQPLIF